MKTKNNQIIHDMHIENLTQVENYDKIRFEVGRIREENETFEGTAFGKPYHYIKSPGIYFPISKESAEAIIGKMVRLIELKKYVDESESGWGSVGERAALRFVKVPLSDKKEITIPKDAIGVKRIKNDITWFEPY